MPAMPNIPGLRKHQEDGTIPEEDALAAGAAAEAAIAEEATGGDDEDKSRYQAARYVGAKTVDRDGGKQACSRRMGFPGYIIIIIDLFTISAIWFNLISHKTVIGLNWRWFNGGNEFAWDDDATAWMADYIMDAWERMMVALKNVVHKTQIYYARTHSVIWFDCFVWLQGGLDGKI